MMKFKRWKKLIVMLMVATMFLQSVVVYADDGTDGMPSVTETQTTTLDKTPTGTPNVATPVETPTGTPNVATPVETPTGTSGAITPGEGLSDKTTDKVNNLDKETEERLLKTESVKEEVPEEVQVFLDAVAKLPDSITTAEEYDAVEAAMENLSAQYDALSDEAKNGDSVKNAKAKLDKLQEQLENGRPEEEEEVPAEVKAFLDEVAKLPEASEITIDNAAEILEQLCSETLSDGYAMVDYNRDEAWANREDVKAACAKYEAVLAAAEEMLALAPSIYKRL